jgi:hypothetical protein
MGCGEVSSFPRGGLQVGPGSIAILAFGRIPGNEFVTGCAVFEPAFHLPERFLKIDNHEEDRENCTEGAPDKDIAPTITGKDTASCCRDKHYQQKYGIAGLNII